MAKPQISTDPRAVRQRIEAMERVLEGLFLVPGTKRQVGLDAILSLIPTVGSVSAAALGSYILWEARNLKLSKMQMARMGGNVGVDLVLGAIPFIGVIPDFFFRSNSRNLRIIRRHLDKHHPETGIVEATAKPVDPSGRAPPEAGSPE